MSTKSKLFFLFLTVIVIVNSYFLFNKDSTIPKAYYLNEYEIVTPATYVEIIPKDALIASAEQINITADATDLNEIRVQSGQQVTLNQQLALYNEDKKQSIVASITSEISAYEQELTGLKNALAEIERLGTGFNPNSSITSQQIDEFLSVSVQAEIMQEQSTSGAIALLKQHIAATERQLIILTNDKRAAEQSRSINSPVNGSLGDIIHQDGKVHFTIYSDELHLVAYVTETEWNKIELNQEVAIEVPETSEILYGIVDAKQSLPARDSIWFTAAKEKQLVQNENENVYEIRINPTVYLLNQALASNASIDIKIQTSEFSNIAPSKWISSKKFQEDRTIHSIYALGYDGKTRVFEITPLNEMPLHRARAIASEESEEVIESEKLTDEYIEDAPLKALHQRIQSFEEDEDHSITSFVALNEGHSIILNERKKNVYAPTFVPLPLQKFEFKEIDSLTWQKVVKYLFY